MKTFLLSEATLMVDKILTSVIRTAVPALVGVIVAAVAVAGLHLDGAIVTPTITLAVTTAYYAGVRWLEVKVGPKFGWLLGKAGAPQYAAKTTPVAPATV